MITPLIAALNEFRGMTADQIADLMRYNGIKGRPGTAGRCPVADLLHKLHGGRFLVGQKSICRGVGKHLERVSTPKSVAVFVRRFDHVEYPDLIAPPPRVLRGGKPRPKSKHPAPNRVRGGKAPKIRRPAKEVGRF
jgi:hypothetical protein